MTTAPTPAIAKRFLQPGQFVVSAEPLHVTTILGSCVAVTLYDVTRRVGGLNHFMLPMSGGSTAGSPRFGDVAMTELVNGVRSLGARLPFLQARVFGGACMFAAQQSAKHLGVQNAEIALDFLSRSGIEVVQIDTGGNRGRKLTFSTGEGAVWLTSI